MFRSKLALSIVALGLTVGLGVGQPQKGQPKKEPVAAEDDGFQDDLKVLRQNGLKGDGPDILEYFRKRTLKQPDPKHITALVKQLGDEDFPLREKAFAELATMGVAALAGLKQGENDPSLEIRKRVGDLKRRIDTKAEPTLQSAAARVLAKQKPAGTADGLMAFLPFASEAMVVDEICKTLGAVAVKDGKIEPVILKSLEDPIAVKRGAAGEALARAGVKEEFPAVKKLYADKDPTVRLRVSLAMMTTQDRDVVPVMIDLLAELTPNQLWPIEEALIRLAGEKAPNVGLGSDPGSRKACRDAWAKWYDANATSLDMAKLNQENAYLGYTLIVQHNNRIGPGGAVNQGEIFELDKDKKVRWKFQMAQGYPVDAQMLNSSRVLVAEYHGGRVTERDLRGEVKWEYACGNNPFVVQRLPNGNTFVAMQSRLVEIDRNKNEVWSYQHPQNNIMRAKKLPTGEVAFVTNLGVQATYIRMDPKNQNKINKQFPVTAVQILFGAMDVLPNGHVLLAHYQQQCFKEYDENGGQVSNTQFNWPSSIVRLPNGGNLIASYNQRRIVEYRGGQAVWEYQSDGLVFVARRR